ncbi:MAG: hypothetical protein HY268_17475 [Deltaproteobacteria bacterium]|nr:hypothetical protein [Deltaproteobacteria bacterium]
MTLLLPLRNGYDSAAAAERDYGVIITEPLQLDDAATAACRRARKDGHGCASP